MNYYGESKEMTYWWMKLQVVIDLNMRQLLLLGKVEYGGGPIFKVVLEC